jgi:hypothetical protein
MDGVVSGKDGRGVRPGVAPILAGMLVKVIPVSPSVETKPSRDVQPVAFDDAKKEGAIPRPRVERLAQQVGMHDKWGAPE